MVRLIEGTRLTLPWRTSDVKIWWHWRPPGGPIQVAERWGLRLRYTCSMTQKATELARCAGYCWGICSVRGSTTVGGSCLQGTLSQRSASGQRPYLLSVEVFMVSVKDYHNMSGESKLEYLRISVITEPCQLIMEAYPRWYGPIWDHNHQKSPVITDIPFSTYTTVILSLYASISCSCSSTGWTPVSSRSLSITGQKQTIAVTYQNNSVAGSLSDIVSFPPYMV